jgi:glutathione S-transferase
MKLYNANFSRVRAVALELGIDLEIIEVDLRGGDNRSATFLSINPNAKVPVLDDDDFVIWESRAITSYLASKKPERGLYPDDPKARAGVDQWLYWQTIHLGPAMQKLSFERFLKPKFGMGDPDQAVIDAELKNVDQFLAVLEIGLEGKDWIAGDLSVADFALASTFMYRAQSDIALDDLPNVAGWIERLEARPSWKDAFAPVRALLGL